MWSSRICSLVRAINSTFRRRSVSVPRSVFPSELYVGQVIRLFYLSSLWREHDCRTWDVAGLCFKSARNKIEKDNELLTKRLQQRPVCTWIWYSITYMGQSWVFRCYYMSKCYYLKRICNVYNDHHITSMMTYSKSTRTHENVVSKTLTRTLAS